MTLPFKRCPVCHGRGAIRCDCWPGDCICGWDDEPCDNCDGTGDANYNADFYPDYDEPIDPPKTNEVPG